MHLPDRRPALAVAALLAAAPCERLAAQIDYRNLDDDRPTRVEDAYPVERYAFEFLLPYAFERERSGASIHASVLELAYGVVPNAHIGLKAPIAAIRQAGTTEWGLSGLRVFALYNLNTESSALPAVSLRADATFPVGSFGGNETQFAVKGILTRSWGQHRIHLNGAARIGTDAPGPAVEGLDRWWAGAALDRTLFRQSVLVIGEVYARRLTQTVPVEVNAGLGLRWQWRPTTVIDIGVTRRLKEDVGPDYAVTLGISNAFAIAGLMPRGR
ncbi:MAG TPA: hypothetical protein VF970_00840 [Gemmatimonadales bacterium]